MATNSYPLLLYQNFAPFLFHITLYALLILLTIYSKTCNLFMFLMSCYASQVDF